MATTLCVSGDVVDAAGSQVDETPSDATWTSRINQAEGAINSATRYNWNDAYSGLNADVKEILKMTCAELAAMRAINYNLDNYSSTTKVQTMLDYLRDSVLRNISILRNIPTQTFMLGA